MEEIPVLKYSSRKRFYGDGDRSEFERPSEPEDGLGNRNQQLGSSLRWQCGRCHDVSGAGTVPAAIAQIAHLLLIGYKI